MDGGEELRPYDALIDADKLHRAFLNEEEMRLPIADRDRLARLRRAEYEIKFDKQDNREVQTEAQLRNEVLLYLADGKRGEASELLVKHIKKGNYIYTTRDDDKPEVWLG